MMLAVRAAPVAAAKGVTERIFHAIRPSSVPRLKVQRATGARFWNHHEAWRARLVPTAGRTSSRISFDCQASFCGVTSHGSGYLDQLLGTPARLGWPVYDESMICEIAARRHPSGPKGPPSISYRHD